MNTEQNHNVKNPKFKPGQEVFFIDDGLRLQSAVILEYDYSEDWYLAKLPSQKQPIILHEYIICATEEEVTQKFGRRRWRWC